MRYFTTSHEWIDVDANNIGTVGITAHAADQLGDIVFVEVPDSGLSAAKGDKVAVIESVKAASDVYAPVSGEIVANNQDIVSAPGGVSESPEGTGWFFKIKLLDTAELKGMMDQAAYLASVKDQS
jgi:glycine cleavage system H protein